MQIVGHSENITACDAISLNGRASPGRILHTNRPDSRVTVMKSQNNRKATEMDKRIQYFDMNGGFKDTKLNPGNIKENNKQTQQELLHVKLRSSQLQ
jgi:hypothetical protein